VLRWRLIIGPLLIAMLAALCWADAQAAHAGIWLLPLAVLLCLLATQELLELLRAGPSRPLAWTVYVGTLLPLLAACAPIAWLDYPPDCPLGRLGWLAGGMAAGLLVAVVGEMSRYAQSGPTAAPDRATAADLAMGADASTGAEVSIASGSVGLESRELGSAGLGSTGLGQTTANLAAAAFSVLYVGGLLGFLVQLRLLPVAGNVSRGGLLAMLSMIIVVKATDIGAYTAGHLWGRRKLAPSLSPGKTCEGAIGGLVLAIGCALLCLGPLARSLGVVSQHDVLPWFGSALLYGLLVSVAGIVGDLAESLLKRDAGVKDSSQWLPGFGGVLDLLDSLLLAAPVAYFCWVSGLLGY
jgi:phosphatidate cytidylyltransferase